MTKELEEYRVLPNWDAKIAFIGRVRRHVGRNSDVMVEFRKEVCRYNARQPISKPIRSIRTGRLLKPGSFIYKQTLKRCSIVRHHSDCDDILSSKEGDWLTDPVTGKRLLKRGRKGERIFAKCYRKRS
jgi:hypothetical protein